jgi:hypothetical protein
MAIQDHQNKINLCITLFIYILCITFVHNPPPTFFWWHWAFFLLFTGPLCVSAQAALVTKKQLC